MSNTEHQTTETHTPAPPEAIREPAQDPGSIDEELRDGAAIRAAYAALDDVSGTVTEHCDRLSTLMFDTAHQFFDAAHAERCRLMFRNAVTKARNIPPEAKAALLELHELYDLKQFDSYGRAGVIVGVAAGLRGLGAAYVGPVGDEKGGPGGTSTPAGPEISAACSAIGRETHDGPSTWTHQQATGER